VHEDREGRRGGKLPGAAEDYLRAAVKFLCAAIFVALVGSVAGPACWAQGTALPGQPITLENTPQRDTTDRTPSSDWDATDARVYLTHPVRGRTRPDTSVHDFHRRPLALPWWRDLGNLGSPARPLFFRPQNMAAGPSLGYTAFDAYRYIPDSLAYWNTTRPYSFFNFMLGTRSESRVELGVTQNIRPAWNVALLYRKTTSPGFFKIQRTNHDNAALTTDFTSPGKHYALRLAATFNNHQHDENGGILSEDFLLDDAYGDRQTVPVRFQATDYGVRRSPVETTLRDVGLLLAHRYTFGPVDTAWAEDSTSYTATLRPRFAVAHRLEGGTQRYRFRDLRPDSLRYDFLFARDFLLNDSVTTEQRWQFLDNALALEGFARLAGETVRVSAGAGARTDYFRTERIVAEDESQLQGNVYLTGAVGNRGDGLPDTARGPWAYSATARLFVLGPSLGNGEIHARLGRRIGARRETLLEVGANAVRSDAPYNYTTYRNAYFGRRADLVPETKAAAWASASVPRAGLSAGVRAWALTNLVYLNEAQDFSQWAPVFNVAQGWVRHLLPLGKFVLDNEIAVQQRTGGGPVNVPLVAGRTALSYERFLFNRALQLATGIEARYHTPYNADGWSPFFGRFFFQESILVSNVPEATAFFNFRVKRFRAYLSGDQLQQLVWRKNVITAPGYPAQSAMFRGGFSWVLVN